MHIFTIIQTTNQDCRLSNKINDSIFTEGKNNNVNTNQDVKWFPTIDKCILSMCDKMIYRLFLMMKKNFI